MNRKLIAGGLLALLVALSGCGGPAVDLDFKGTFDTSNENFRVEGKVENEGMKTVRLENVTVYLYAANGTLLNSTDLPPFEGRSERFTLTAAEPPKYVIFYTPEVQAYNEVSIEYRVYRDGEYWPDGAENRSGLPVTIDVDSAR